MYFLGEATMYYPVFQHSSVRRATSIFLRFSSLPECQHGHVQMEVNGLYNYYLLPLFACPSASRVSSV